VTDASSNDFGPRNSSTIVGHVNAHRGPSTSDRGVITLDDVNQLLIDELENLGDVIESESPPY